MGVYANPPQQIEKYGRALYGREYKQLTAQLKEGESLWALYDRGIFKLCVNLYSQEEFDEFNNQDKRGEFVSSGKFYAAKKEVLEHNGVHVE